MWCAPGNAGIAGETVAANGSAVECVGIGAEDLPALLELAREQQIDLTVVGPDNLLAMGIVDQFQAAGLRAWGHAAGRAVRVVENFLAGIHGSQRRADDEICVVHRRHRGEKVAASLDGKCAVKADGLALGKGVLICNTPDEANAAIDQIMTDRAFGDAGSRC